MSAEQAFCTECGTALHGAKFCPQCGAVTENATGAEQVAATRNGKTAEGAVAVAPPEVEPTVARMRIAATGGAGAPVDSHTLPASSEPPAANRGFPPPSSTAPRQRSAATGGRRPLLIGAAVGIAVVAVIAVAVIVLLGSGASHSTQAGGGASYSTQARVALTPVIRDNNQLSSALASLSASSGAGRAKTTAQTTIGAVQAAQGTLGSLKPGSGDRQFASNLSAAMGSELAWLNAVVSVMGSRSSPMLSQLGSLGVDTQTKLAAIDPQVPGASASFSGSTKLIAYAQNQASAASTKYESGDARSRSVAALRPDEARIVGSWLLSCAAAATEEAGL